MRLYRHTTYGRREPSWINYLWCGNCHAYSSSFTGAGRKMVESDPLLAEFGDRISEVFDASERLLKVLDGYWKAGKLPQMISRRTPCAVLTPRVSPHVRGTGIRGPLTAMAMRPRSCPNHGRDLRLGKSAGLSGGFE